MKKINLVLAIIVMLGLSIPSQTKAQRGVSVSFQFFYDNLSPYGSWISYPQYGYVWHPNVGRGFQPYRTSGHWVWSNEYDWIWVSDYEWGWAPFHYGRWQYDSYYGWLWIPDYEWAPAWVAWRGGGDYYGWAPLGPGISISIAFGNYSPPYNYWSFVPRRYIASPAIYNYYVSPQQNTTIINNTTVINNYSTSGGPERNVFVSGPQKAEVERYTQQSLTSVKLNESSSPGRTRASGNEVAIYKPKVNASDKRSAKPSKVMTADKSNRSNEPQRNQPVKTQPQKEQPVRNEPQKNQPIRTEPQKKQPVTTEPQRNQPVKTQPQKEQPIRNEPPKSQPARNEPQPPKSQPQKEQPVRNEPPKNQPVRNEPQPPKSQPQKDQPQKTEPAKNQPPKKKNGNG